ncbi:uncharacterized protein LOC126771475 [Nymphalis io]|uniref:uncharacterized protein LOC126771475 n=1 Tax=Inachis io TaxID=171585 RepID=UPI002169FF76|nr:uncharacterized protein LOC126771475 [Nymphalis io]
MTALVRLAILAICACAHAQYAEERAPRYIASEPKVAPTPVPILKQINKHNEDGSYTYGYEAADGSFKIETKSPSGEVKGKYGYKDDTGKVRVIEYGANKYGFQPAGEGITVAPPTLVDESTRDEGLRPGKGQNGRSQYREQSVDYDYEEPAPAPTPRPAPRPAPRPTPQPAYRAPPQQQQYRPAPQPQEQYRPAPQPQEQYRSAPQPQQQYRPAPQPQQQYRPAPQQSPTPPKPAFFAGAAPVPAEDNFFNPEPQPRQQQYRPKQDFRPAPQPQQFSPKHTQVDFNQDYNSAPQSQPRYQSNQRSQPFSMLDQLLKEYALPQGGAAPLHDITFGSY